MKRLVAMVVLGAGLIASACGPARSVGPSSVPIPGSTAPDPSTGTSVQACTDYWSIAVNLTARQLTVFQMCEPVMTTAVGVGKPSTPTPTGRFHITGLFRKRGEYGPYLYSLSARSKVLPHYLGGEGTIGIHGVLHHSDPGHAVSHGCIRVPRAALLWMVHRLAIGTPVRVSMGAVLSGMSARL